MQIPAFRFIVCGNGFGHLRRVLKVGASLHAMNGHCRIYVECKSTNLSRIAKDPEVASILESEFISFGHLSADLAPEYAQHTSYFAFEEWLSVFDAPRKGELVILDNEAILLQKFPEAVLMGSFLWSDVIESKKWASLSAYIAAERAVLAHRKPYMLGLEDMAMDGVRRHTRFVPLPWFVQREEGLEAEVKTDILLTMGGSGKEKEFLSLPFLSLLEEKADMVFTDARLGLMLQGKFGVFDFSSTAFSRTKLVIGRPGIGILTECVQYGIPIACVYEKDNAEMVHNAQCVEKLGIGIDLMSRDESQHAGHIISLMNSESTEQHAGFGRIQYYGANAAAQWLMNKWEEENNKIIS
jgi:hypothetical protein